MSIQLDLFEKLDNLPENNAQFWEPINEESEYVMENKTKLEELIFQLNCLFQDPKACSITNWSKSEKDFEPSDIDNHYSVKVCIKDRTFVYESSASREHLHTWAYQMIMGYVFGMFLDDELWKTYMAKRLNKN